MRQHCLAALMLVIGMAFQVSAATSDELSQRVAGLAAGTPAEAAKKAMLEVAVERLNACDAAGSAEAVAMLRADIEAALAIDAATLANASGITKHIGTLRDVPVVDGNPYLIELLRQVRGDLEKPDVEFPKCTDAVNAFDGIEGPRGSRTAGAKLEDYFWLYAHPSSPMRGDPELLKRLLRRYHAYIDAIQHHSAAVKTSSQMGGQLKHIYDDFAMGPASAVLREFAVVYPQLLLPSQRADLDSAMRLAGQTIFAGAKDRPGNYANIDAAVAFELLNLGLHTNEPVYLKKAEFLVHAQRKNLLPAGAFKYIWSQNESATYHDTVCDYLARYYEVTEDPVARQILIDSQWHGPTLGRFGEFWTAPSWKQMWNRRSGTFSGGEVVAALSDNAYQRAILDFNLSQKRFGSPRRQLAWYTTRTNPVALPDQYVIRDENIVGPRAWYDRFSYAATLRPIPNTEPGHATIIGCLMLQPDSTLQSVVMGVYPRARIKPNSLAADGQIDNASWAWITSDLKGDFCVSRDASIVGASYLLHASDRSRKGTLSDWRGRQLWLGLPDRIIGVLDIAPASGTAKAFEVNGVVRLGTGGTEFGPPQTLKPLGANRYAYGDLQLVLHQSNYASAEAVVLPFRNKNAPVTELTLRDAAGQEGVREYPAGERFVFIVEIRSNAAKGDAKVAAKTDKGAMELTATIGADTYIAIFNPSENPVDAAVNAAAMPVSVHRSTQGVVRELTGPVRLKAHESVLVITSGDKAKHEPGVGSFEELTRRGGK